MNAFYNSLLPLSIKMTRITKTLIKSVKSVKCVQGFQSTLRDIGKYQWLMGNSMWRNLILSFCFIQLTGTVWPHVARSYWVCHLGLSSSSSSSSPVSLCGKPVNIWICFLLTLYYLFLLLISSLLQSSKKDERLKVKGLKIKCLTQI